MCCLVAADFVVFLSFVVVVVFFFNDTATTEIYTLSLHDALPISCNSNDRLDYKKNYQNPLDGH